MAKNEITATVRTAYKQYLSGTPFTTVVKRLKSTGGAGIIKRLFKEIAGAKKWKQVQAKRRTTTEITTKTKTKTTTKRRTTTEPAEEESMAAEA